MSSNYKVLPKDSNIPYKVKEYTFNLVRVPSII